MAKLFSKILTETDIGKRLSVPTQKKKCFLNFEGRHKVEFEVIDMEGNVCEFVCSTRKKGDYPKPVLSKGWLDFVRRWKLAVGDEVILYRKQDKAVALSLVYVDIKNWAVGKIPSTEELKEAWSEWEVRCLVLLSLILQLLLILSAHLRQRYKGRFLPCVAAFVWSIYLAADWVATLSMTTILRGTFEKENEVVVLWTPFLLWHLGSPANITAYSLEDNELWLRHFLGLVSNAAEAVYIYVKFRAAGAPNFRSVYHLDLMVVPLLIGGILKYGERIVALRCASSEQLRSALYSGAKDNRRMSKGKGMIRTGLYESAKTGKAFVETKVIDPGVKFLREAHVSFEIFRPLFLDLPFEISKVYHEHKVFLKDKSAEEAFRLVNVELQFLYDLFFTKNPIQHRYQKLNAILCVFYIFSALSVLIAFSTKNIAVSKSDIPSADITVTYLLLVGAIFLDTYAVVLHLWSRWTMIGFGIAGGKLHKFYYWLVAFTLPSIKSEDGIPNIAQYDVLRDFCSLPGNNIFTRVINLIDSKELRKKFDYISWVEVDLELKKFIYSAIEKEAKDCHGEGSALDYFSKRMFPEDLQVSLRPFVSFECGKDKSKQMPAGLIRAIIICHIATKLAYYNDLERSRPVNSSFCRISNVLSDYMLYLVLVHPLMLPKEYGEIEGESFVPESKRADLIRKKSYRIASKFSKGKLNPTAAAKQLASLLYVIDAGVFFNFKFDSRNNSLKEKSDIMKRNPALLIQGHIFSAQLQSLRRWQLDNDEKWELLSDLWMGMVIHAAKHCPWKKHAQELRHGGELLTYVSLLMAHFGSSHLITIHEDNPDDNV